MILLRAARGAALGATAVASLLLAGMAGLAQASGGGGTAPPPSAPSHYLGDAPNRKHDQNLVIGWDMLERSGWANSSYGWNVSYAVKLNDDTRDNDGHLIAGNLSDGDGAGGNNIWGGSGQSPADYKDVDTISMMRPIQPHHATAYYMSTFCIGQAR